MTTQTILEQAGIPLLLFVICMYYGLKLMILQDVSTIRGKNKEPVKDEKAYAKKRWSAHSLFLVLQHL